MNKYLATIGIGLLSIVAMPASQQQARADEYPSKPVTIIVPLAAGGGTDRNARLMAQGLTDALGQQFVVENHPGAAGTIGVKMGLAAEPDGYTLIVVGGSYSVNPALRKLDFDAVEDVTPVVQFSEGGQLLIANPKLGVKTVEELIAMAKAEPGKISSAAVGVGSISHMATALLSSMADIELTAVQYKGSGPAMNDTIAGVTGISFASPSSAFPQVEAGTLVALAATSKSPMPGHPEVPTIDSSGLPGFEVSLWYGIIGPKGMPDDVVGKINSAVNDMLKQPETVEAINKGGHVPVGGSPADFKANLSRQVAQWKNVAEGLGLEPQ